MTFSGALTPTATRKDWSTVGAMHGEGAASIIGVTMNSATPMKGTVAVTAIPNITGPHFVAGSLPATTRHIGRTSAMDIANGSDNIRSGLPQA
jgi:hypothetical protein